MTASWNSFTHGNTIKKDIKKGRCIHEPPGCHGLLLRCWHQIIPRRRLRSYNIVYNILYICVYVSIYICIYIIYVYISCVYISCVYILCWHDIIWLFCQVPFSRILPGFVGSPGWQISSMPSYTWPRCGRSKRTSAREVLEISHVKIRMCIHIYIYLYM